jgi:heat shock protein HslJ
VADHRHRNDDRLDVVSPSRPTILIGFRIAIFVAAAVVAGGAGAQRGPDASGEIAALEGPVWRLASLRGLDAGSLRAATRPVTARFSGGRIDGFSGCNSFFGAYTIDGDQVVVGSLGGTMMACPEVPMAVETAVKNALVGTFRYTLADHLLTLHAGAEPVMVFQRESTPRLEGAAWKVTGFNNGRQAVVSPLPGTTLSLTFRGGTVTGSGGCNTFRAKYTATTGQVVIGPAAATRKACLAEGVMQQEREFLAALESATTWTFDGRLLDMHRADGARALTATRSVD